MSQKKLLVSSSSFLLNTVAHSLIERHNVQIIKADEFTKNEVFEPIPHKPLMDLIIDLTPVIHSQPKSGQQSRRERRANERKNRK